MKKKQQNNYVLVFGLSLWVLFASGCVRTVCVEAVGIGDKSVEVNLVGINDLEFSRWENMSMTEYWKPGSPMRINAPRYIMKFGQDLTRKQCLRKDDEIWKAWDKRNDIYLFILADLPGEHADQIGNADTRRLILPIRWQCWDWLQNRLDISLEPGGIICFTPPKPECRN